MLQFLIQYLYFRPVPVVKLVLLTSANMSLIFLKPTNVLHSSIERYVYRPSTCFLLHQNQKKWMRNRSLKIKFIH